jgi:arginyl-tRNA synthetase
MKFQFQDDLAAYLSQELQTEVAAPELDLCPAEFTGDVTISCFPLAKALRRNPMQLAPMISAWLSKHPDIESAEAVKAFVNLTVKPEALMRGTVAASTPVLEQVALPESERRKILIEFSAPNTNKPQHLGHVRNNTIGMATASILKRVGHQVVQVNLVNDRGVHICKSMLAYQRFGNGCTPESTGKKGDHLVGDFYVAYDKEFTRQVQELKASRPELQDKSSDELFLETEIGRATQNMLVAWEQGDPEVRALWTMMNSWVFKGFEETYARLGVKFDHLYLESQTYKLGKDIIADGLQRGVFKKREDGAVIIEFPEKNLGTKVVLRSDGTSVYITQDIGTTLLKQKDYEPDQQIWVVGDEQIRHFQVLFAILKALGYSWADNLLHMAYGMVNLPSGKMKSREGTVVDADDLFDEMCSLAREATLQRAGDNVPDDLEKRAEIIGFGALKFMLLKVNPKTTIMFDPAASIKFEGDTGPYVLYAFARISSMLRKAGVAGEPATVDWSLLATAAEKRLALLCAKYPEAVRRAAREYDSSVLASYLLDLAKAFSAFYSQCPVLNAQDENVRLARLVLASRVRDIIGDGLHTLTIQTMDAM